MLNTSDILSMSIFFRKLSRLVDNSNLFFLSEIILFIISQVLSVAEQSIINELLVNEDVISWFIIKFKLFNEPENCLAGRFRSTYLDYPSRAQTLIQLVFVKLFFNGVLVNEYIQVSKFGCRLISETIFVKLTQEIVHFSQNTFIVILANVELFDFVHLLVNMRVEVFK